MSDTMDRQTITVQVFQAEQCDESFPRDLTVVEFIKWLEGHLASIPEEFRQSATVEIGSFSSWEDSHYAEIEISYTRPETDEEVRQRRARVTQCSMAKVAQMRAEYERLRAIFGANPGGLLATISDE